MALTFLCSLSIRQRLLLLTMLTSAIGVLPACVGYLIYDYHQERRQKMEEIQSLAAIIGTNATAALAFDDAAGATKLLESLRTRPHIRMGVLYRDDGAFFASYIRPDLTRMVLAPRAEQAGEVWEQDRLKVTSPVFLDGRGLGSLYLEKDLEDLQQRTRRSLQLTALIAGLSLLVVYFLTATLQRSVTGPITQLAEIVRWIAMEKIILFVLLRSLVKSFVNSALTSITCWEKSHTVTPPSPTPATLWRSESPPVPANWSMKSKSVAARRRLFWNALVFSIPWWQAVPSR